MEEILLFGIATFVLGIFITLFTDSLIGGIMISSIICAIFYILLGEYAIGISVLSFYLIIFLILIIKDYINGNFPFNSKATKKTKLPLLLWICAILTVIAFIVIILSYKSPST